MVSDKQQGVLKKSPNFRSSAITRFMLATTVFSPLSPFSLVSVAIAVELDLKTERETSGVALIYSPLGPVFGDFIRKNTFVNKNKLK